MIVGGKRGGVVWTKAVHFPVTIPGINITFKVYICKVVSCIAFTIRWCTIQAILIVGEGGSEVLYGQKQRICQSRYQGICRFSRKYQYKKIYSQYEYFLCFYLNLNCKYIKVIYPTFES